MTRLQIVLYVVGFLLIATSFASATTNTWQGGTGDWGDMNWSVDGGADQPILVDDPALFVGEDFIFDNSIGVFSGQTMTRIGDVHLEGGSWTHTTGAIQIIQGDDSDANVFDLGFNEVATTLLMSGDAALVVTNPGNSANQGNNITRIREGFVSLSDDAAIVTDARFQILQNADLLMMDNASIHAGNFQFGAGQGAGNLGTLFTFESGTLTVTDPNGLRANGLGANGTYGRPLANTVNFTGGVGSAQIVLEDNSDDDLNFELSRGYFAIDGQIVFDKYTYVNGMGLAVNRVGAIDTLEIIERPEGNIQWISDTDGVWSESTNWDPGVVPIDGTRDIYFNSSTVRGNTDRIITLDTGVAVNRMVFASVENAYQIRDDSANAIHLIDDAEIRTLAENETHVIMAIIGGNSGLHKTGAGQLNLTNVNTYSGMTVVEQGNLEVDFTSALGVEDGTATNGTLVLPGALLVVNDKDSDGGGGGGPFFAPENGGEGETTSQELVTLAGGEVLAFGNSEFPIRLEGQGTVRLIQYYGKISGSGDLIASNANLYTANNYEGLTIVTGELDARHPMALGSTDQPTFVMPDARAIVTANTEEEIHVKDSVLWISVEDYTGPVIMRSGLIQSRENVSASLASPLILQGRVDLGQPAFDFDNNPLRLNAGTIGKGELSITGINRIDGPIAHEGTLRVTGSVAIGTSEPIDLPIILDDASIAFAQSRVAPQLVMLQDSTVNGFNGVSLTWPESTLRVNSGKFNLPIEGVSEVIKTGDDTVYLFDIGFDNDAVVRVEGGTLYVDTHEGLGNSTGHTEITSRAGAAVSLSGRNDMEWHESFVLNNATGIQQLGALRGTGILHGSIDLGSEGASVSGSRFYLNGAITGGDLTVIGDSIRMTGVDKQYSGTTYVGVPEVSSGSLILQQDTRLSHSPTIVVHRGSNLTHFASANDVNKVRDDLVLELRGGLLHVSSASSLIMGDLVVGDNLSDVYADGQIQIQALRRAGRGGVIFQLENVQATAPETMVNGIIGAWAYATRDRSTTDFATLDASDFIVELDKSERPFELNGANPSDNILIQSNPVAMLANHTVNSLAFSEVTTDDNALVDLGGFELDVLSGGVANFDVDEVMIANGRLTSSYTKELIVFADSTISIGADIVDAPGGPVGLTILERGGRIKLSGQNTFSGPVYLAGDQSGHAALDILNQNAIPTGADLTNYGSSVRFEFADPVSLGEVLIGEDGDLQGELIEASSIELRSGSVESIVGETPVFKTTYGQASLGMGEDYAGLVTVDQGELRVFGQSTGAEFRVLQKGELRWEILGANHHIDLANGSLVLDRDARVEGHVTVSLDSRIVISRLYDRGSDPVINDLTIDDSRLDVVGDPRLDLTVEGIVELSGDTSILIDRNLVVFDGKIENSDDDTTLHLVGNPYYDGQLQLNADNSQLTAPINITDLIVSIGHPNALGSGRTTVGNGAIIQFNPGEYDVDLHIDGGRINPDEETVLHGNISLGGQTRLGYSMFSPLVLHTTGSLSMSDEAELVVDLFDPITRGYLDPESHDQVIVEGAASLAGGLKINQMYPYTLDPKDDVVILSANTISGVFDQDKITGYLTDDSNLRIAVLYDTTEEADRESAIDFVRLVATLPGDANGDGRVSLIDLNRLGQSFGVSGTWQNGDYNYDGVIGLSDFSLLSQNYNQSVLQSVAASSTIMPEPSSLVLLSMVLLGGFRRSNRL